MCNRLTDLAETSQNTSLLFPLRYSPEANQMKHKCRCCQEVKTSKRQVALTCLDGSTMNYSYIYVEDCSCVGSQCVPEPTPTSSQEQQQQEEEQQQGQEEK